MLRIDLEVGLDLSVAHKHQLEQLKELDEIHLIVVQNTIAFQQQQTKWHDKFIKKKVFQKGDWVLLYDSRFKDFKENLCSTWMGPYEVVTVFENGIVKLTTIDEAHTPLFVNKHHLNLYQLPTSRYSFIKNIFYNFGFEIICPKNTSSAPYIYI